jgi:hypothetical protein
MFVFNAWIRKSLANLMFFYHTGNLYFGGQKNGKIVVYSSVFVPGLDIPSSCRQIIRPVL